MCWIKGVNLVIKHPKIDQNNISSYQNRTAQYENNQVTTYSRSEFRQSRRRYEADLSQISKMQKRNGMMYQLHYSLKRNYNKRAFYVLLDDILRDQAWDTTISIHYQFVSKFLHHFHLQGESDLSYRTCAQPHL